MARWSNPGVIILIIILATLALSGGCASPQSPPATQPAATPVIKTISAQEAPDFIVKNQNNPNFMIIDVRTPGEFADGHIDKAINIDVQSADFESNVGKLSRDKTYLVYCRSGARSTEASTKMEQMGFKDLYNMSGGISQLIQEGYPVVK
jgi:rhodanese-related sulfurtransferase